MKRLLAHLALFVLVVAVPAMAADLNNNGVRNDETFVPEPFGGTMPDDETVPFPITGDTFQVAFYPYWWNAGDTVFGMRTVPLPTVSHADVAFKISYNVLNSGGHCDFDFRINGTTVGSFVVTEADGTGTINASFDFPPVAPPFELRYTETNTVAGGAGSISIDESGLSTVTFTGEGTPTEATSWSVLKGEYSK